jgi:hypothetical protein
MTRADIVATLERLKFKGTPCILVVQMDGVGVTPESLARSDRPTASRSPGRSKERKRISSFRLVVLVAGKPIPRAMTVRNRLAAALQFHVNAIELHAQKKPRRSGGRTAGGGSSKTR